jgi:spermidine/putrescine transport system permease protein
VLYLPVIIPDIVMALSTLLFFVMFAIPLSRYTILIAHIAFNISFVAIVVRARLAGMDARLEEAAADLGADEWTTFRRITLPLLMPGIVAAALLAFTLSLDDFVITFFVAGPGSTTLPVRVYSMIKFGVTPEVNAISTLMFVGSTLLVIFSLLLQRR